MYDGLKTARYDQESQEHVAQAMVALKRVEFIQQILSLGPVKLCNHLLSKTYVNSAIACE